MKKRCLNKLKKKPRYYILSFLASRFDGLWHQFENLAFRNQFKATTPMHKLEQHNIKEAEESNENALLKDIFKN